MVNPDGVVAGNYRANLQGKDMNRHFFEEEDEEEACVEVELIRKYMREHLHGNLRMFLDIHAHSVKKSVFLYAPKTLERTVFP